MNQFILGVDTSSLVGSMALFVEDGTQLKFVADKDWKKDRSHSEIITQKFVDLLHENNLKSSDLSALICGVGPGSFTGIRVGLSFVKSVAYANDLPVYSYDSLNLLAGEGLDQKLPILCMVNAYKNMIYCSVYEVENKVLKTVMKPVALNIPELEKELNTLCLPNCFVLGNGHEIYVDQFSPDLLSRFIVDGRVQVGPRARTFGQIWEKTESIAKRKSWEDVIPLYIRASEAEEKLQMGLLKPV